MDPVTAWNLMIDQRASFGLAALCIGASHSSEKGATQILKKQCETLIAMACLTADSSSLSVAAHGLLLPALKRQKGGFNIVDAIWKGVMLAYAKDLLPVEASADFRVQILKLVCSIEGIEKTLERLSSSSAAATTYMIPQSSGQVLQELVQAEHESAM